MRPTVLALLVALAASCGPRHALAPVAECFVTEDCGPDHRCEGGLCVPAVPDTCDPGRTRCASFDVVETCDPSGERWVSDTLPCPGGCDAGRCLPRACRPFELKCSGLTLLICTAQGAGFDLYDQCRFACRVIDGEAQCAAE